MRPRVPSPGPGRAGRAQGARGAEAGCLCSWLPLGLRRQVSEARVVPALCLCLACFVSIPALTSMIGWMRTWFIQLAGLAVVRRHRACAVECYLLLQRTNRSDKNKHSET